jgi:DNA-directed RNA polymerase specialized sigma subunit
MHAPLSILPNQSEEIHHHTWRNGSNGQHYFDSNYARALIEQFNATGDAESLYRLLEHVASLARSIIEYRNTIRHESADELLSRIRIKLWRSLKLYDPAKGTAFSFVAKVISSTAASVRRGNTRFHWEKGRRIGNPLL